MGLFSGEIQNITILQQIQMLNHEINVKYSEESEFE